MAVAVAVVLPVEWEQRRRGVRYPMGGPGTLETAVFRELGKSRGVGGCFLHPRT